LLVAIQEILGMKILVVVLSFLALGSFCAQAQESKRQWKLNPFVGSGVTTAWKNGSQSLVVAAGTAAIIPIPITKKLFLRPVVCAGKVLPLSTAQPFPFVQAGSLLGYRAIKRTSILAGYLETIQFPKSGTLYLPTSVFSTATKIHGGWGVYTPVILNAKAWGISLQVGYNY
jgi:hypothetical protein